MIKKHKHHFEQFLAAQSAYWKGNDLGEACLYALGNGGKRVRPIIVYLIADTLGQGKNVDYAALSTEYFHTASLIADDLPCMDNDDKRRGMPSLHKKFDEQTALLASYALITAAFESIYTAHLGVDAERGMLALQIASECAGFNGATGGQYLDIKTTTLDDALLEEILCKKTVTLFQVAFCFGFLFGGGEIDLLPIVKKAGYHFGISFQIADDLADYIQDEKKVVNAARHWGREKAEAVLESELSQFHKALSGAGLETPEFTELTERITYLAAGSLA